MLQQTVVLHGFCAYDPNSDRWSEQLSPPYGNFSLVTTNNKQLLLLL